MGEQRRKHLISTAQDFAGLPTVVSFLFLKTKPAGIII
jgi:hypothetical protein